MVGRDECKLLFISSFFYLADGIKFNQQTAFVVNLPRTIAF
jgi:hypothetical protein